MTTEIGEEEEEGRFRQAWMMTVDRRTCVLLLDTRQRKNQGAVGHNTIGAREIQAGPLGITIGSSAPLKLPWAFYLRGSSCRIFRTHCVNQSSARITRLVPFFNRPRPLNYYLNFPFNHKIGEKRVNWIDQLALVIEFTRCMLLRILFFLAVRLTAHY